MQPIRIILSGFAFLFCGACGVYAVENGFYAIAFMDFGLSAINFFIVLKNLS